MSKKEKSEHKLIAACMRYAANVAAIHAAFNVDPDGNSKNAERMTDRMSEEMEEDLRAMAKHKAATCHGLLAFSKAMKAMIDAEVSGGFSEAEVDALYAFAENVTAITSEERNAAFAEACEREKQERLAA
jgi:excinuclease UvrABC ATPase subunit